MESVDQVHYIAMEYVEGTNLRDYIRKKGALDLPRAISIMKQAGQAIGAAGEEGLIHRDVKPENILITRQGRVKVADFGLCYEQGDEAMHLTQSGMTMGTPLYMSPEQAQGRVVDHRSDLYSLGVTYYYMLAGVPPFQADSAVALALKHVREIPRSLLVHRPDLPVEIDRLVMKLMAKDPADRFQSAGLMLADLAKIRDSMPVGSTGVLSGAVDNASARTEELPSPTARNELARRTSVPAEVGLARSARAAAVPDVARANPAGGLSGLPEHHRPVFSGLAALVAGVVGLVAGSLWGWGARAPDVQAMPTEPAHALPGLWIAPRWRFIPKQPSPAEQVRYAQLRAPREDSAAAWLAVPGYYPRSHDSLSKAYAQLARLWYRQVDIDSLVALQSELTNWKNAQGHDKELVVVIRLALELRKGDIKEVEKGFKSLTQDGVADMDDPALVAMSLEVCSEALQAAQRSGNQTMAAPLLKALQQLVRQLYKIEVAAPAGVAASRPSV
jgi:serine/threonine-protein kinase